MTVFNPAEGLKLLRYLSLSGTAIYTPSAGTGVIQVAVVGDAGGGAGAASGSSQCSVGGSGGAGSTVIFAYEIQPGDAFDYSTGGGGAGGVGSSPGDAGVGSLFTVQPSSLQAYAEGGFGGGVMGAGTSAFPVAGGLGGGAGTTCSFPDYYIHYGESGTLSMRQSGTYGVAGPGGASYLGSGVPFMNSPNNGFDGVAPGSGGGGAIAIGAAATFNGGAGAPGVILIAEYGA